MDDLPADELSPQINQAAGVLAERHTCSITDALTRLRSQAVAAGTTLEQTARAVLEGSGPPGDATAT